MNRITLAQTITNWEEFRKMESQNIWPLIISVYQEEMKVYLLEKLKSMEFPYDIEQKRMSKTEVYLFIADNLLRYLIETKKIYIPTLIDIEGKIKYVDYIAEMQNNEYSGRIIFRNRKRIFEKSQANYSIQKNSKKYIIKKVGTQKIARPIPGEEGKVTREEVGGKKIIIPIPNKHSNNSIELYDLCTETIWNEDKAIKVKQKILSK